MRRLVVGGVGLAMMAVMAVPALAAKCGNTGSGFEAWKGAFAAEAKANGVGARGLKALAATSYATATIKADRSQHVGSSRVDLQACKLEYSIVSPK